MIQTQTTSGTVHDAAFSVNEPRLRALHSEADGIQAFLGQKANLDDPTSMTVRLNELDAYLARLSDMMSRSKALRDRAQNDFLLENEDTLSKLSATVANRRINTHLFEYTMTYNRLDTMLRTVEHLSRDLVTQISYVKAQMASGL